MKFVGYDSWKRPIYKDEDVEVIAAPSPKPEPKPHVNNYVEATPEDVKEWQNGGDFFMTGKFDAMKLFVVVPAVIQIVVFFMMLAVMGFNMLIFD
tara:strand:- start:599 stop:883 length:285 start_codon:yes stop_codon:yes gene_type:complete